MRAVILAAGFGTRLWPLTEDRTKPAIPFLNRPLIAYSVEYLASYGIRDIIVNLHHQPDSIRRALGTGTNLGVNIHYSFEENILGTSGALDQVRESLTTDDFVVMNGKVVTSIDLKQVIQIHKDRNALATLVLLPNLSLERFSVVEIDDSGGIRRFGGPPEPGPDVAERDTTAACQPPPLMFTGIQVLSPRILDYIPRGVFSHSTVDVYPKAIEAGETVIGHVATGHWFEMSTIRRYLDASLTFLHQRGGDVGGARPDQSGIVAGTGSIVENGAVVSDSVLWQGVTVKAGARVRRSIIGDHVTVPATATLDSAVVVRNSIVRTRERGDVVGENLIVQIDGGKS
ncbi:MAG TPA: NDP-sugar synthase [Blastocatellia bacterium]|nr:NDP-sugar synthase [Blastocatellia bacterium]